LVDLGNTAAFKDLVATARRFLPSEEADELPNLVRSLQQIHVTRALRIGAGLESGTMIERMTRLSTVLESELFLGYGEKHEDSELDTSYGVIAAAFDYIARLQLDPTNSFEYWLRASLCYGIAREDANSRFAARQAFEVRDQASRSDMAEVMTIVLGFMLREIPTVIEDSARLKGAMIKHIFPVTAESSEQKHLQTMGFVNLLEALNVISSYLKDGTVLQGRDWKEHLERAEALFHQGGESYAEWLTSRLTVVANRLVSRSVWTLRDVLPEEYLRALTNLNGEPVIELWTSQVESARSLLKEKSARHSIIVMPTSAGKTLLASMAIARELYGKEGTAFYVAPTRALVSELELKLSSHLSSIGIGVSKVPGGYEHIPVLDGLLEHTSRAFVLTPEKLDLLHRIGDSRLTNCRVFIFDESQILTEEGRGLRFELLVSKIVAQYGRSSRVIIMSATLPESNLSQFVQWIGEGNASDCLGLHSSWKPTRLLEGFFFRAASSKFRGDVHYLTDFTVSGVLPPPPSEVRQDTTDIDWKQVRKVRQDTVKLAWEYQKYLGPVLIYCPSRQEAERVALELFAIAKLSGEKADDILRADAEYVSNILGDNFPLSLMLPYGIGYHHAALPTPVRTVIEKLARSGKLSLVACTSTLLEGVNLNVSTVIISSGRAGASRMKGADFENLAGRAGRALRDTEGHVVLTNRLFYQDYQRRRDDQVRSRFFEYLATDLSSSRLDTDVEAVEAELLTRLYYRQLRVGRLTEDVRILVKGLLFTRQATLVEIAKAENKVAHHARFVIDSRPVNDRILQVFAETGLGLSYCVQLDKRAEALAKRGDLRFRTANGPNWKLVNDAVDACLLSNRRLTSTVRNAVGNQLMVIQGWLSGKTLMNIAADIEQPLRNRTILHLSDFLYLYVGEEVSWACAAFVRLLREHAPNRKLDPEWDLLPSYLKYGVMSPSSLLLSLSGIDDRDAVITIGARAPISPSESLEWIRQIGWVVSIPADIHPQIGPIQEDLMDKIGSFSIPVEVIPGIEGPVVVQSDGEIVLAGKKVGKIPEEFIPLVTRLERPVNFGLRSRGRESFLEVSEVRQSDS
jgi:hypothetical protein